MELTVFMTRYPRAEVPTRGFRCPTCGAEELLLGEAQRVHEIATRLGLTPSTRSERRRLVRIGNSLGVTVSPDALRKTFGTTRAGVELDVTVQGDAIVIRRATDGDHRRARRNPDGGTAPASSP